MPSNLMYVGSYTESSPARGISVFQRDRGSGELTFLNETEIVNPSWLAFDPEQRFLFAVTETHEFEGESGGGVASFSIDPETGELSLINQQPTHGGAPCHLCTDPTGSFLFVANHEHGNVAMFPVGSDGSLEPASHVVQHEGSGPGPTQEGPHAHCVVMDPDGERLLVVDKGIDRVMIYRIDRDARSLVPADPPYGEVHSGAAPRHIAFHPNGRYAYVNGEADMTVSAFRYSDNGELEPLQHLPTLPEEADRGGVTTAGIDVHPSGRFVYVSNRGHDSIAMFSVDHQTGELSEIGHQPTGGQIPRAFGIDPDGNYLYVGNQHSDTIVTFRIDQSSGTLEQAGDPVRMGAPVAFLFT